MTKVTILALIAAIGIADNSVAQSPKSISTDQKIQFLTQDMKLDLASSASAEAIAAYFRISWPNAPASAIDRASLIYRDIYLEIYPDRRSDITNLYRSTFNDNEIDSLYNFYSMPQNRSILRKFDLLDEKFRRYLTGRTEAFYARLSKALESDDQLKELWPVSNRK